MFKKIKGFDNYSVNDSGLVVNNVTNKVLKPSVVNGYLKVNIEGNTKYISRLVAESFIPVPNELKHSACYLDVKHLDGNLFNNQVNNLTWCKRSDTIQSAYGYIGQLAPGGTHNIK